jgi:ABC-type Fe3+-citrate transport system substrate-binding protein
VKLVVAATVFAALAGSTLAQTFPLSIKHEEGTIELKSPAKRVVALDYSFLDALVALGVKPVGAAVGTQGGDRGAPPYLKALTVDVTSIGSRAAPNVEAILAVKPDLILADVFAQKSVYPQLAKVAPTALLNSRLGSYDDLLQQLLLIGKAVGREAAARQLFNNQASLLAKARAFANPNAPSLVAAVATPTSLTVHSSESFVGSLFEKLGRKNAVKPQKDATQFAVSFEGLVALNPSTLVLFTGADETPITREWAKNPLWARIEAVKRGRVYEFDRDLWTRARGPIALKKMLSESINSGLLADKAPAAGFALK